MNSTEERVLAQFKQGRFLDVLKDDGEAHSIFVRHLTGLAVLPSEQGWALQVITMLGRTFLLPLPPFPTEAAAESFAQKCADAMQRYAKNSQFEN